MANQVTSGVGVGAVTVFASAARTATPDTFEYELDSTVRAVHVVWDVTAVTSTPSTTVTIQGVDRLSGKVYTLLASAAIATVTTNILRVGPGLTASANVTASDFLPRVIRITTTHGNANSMTYSMAALFCS